MGCGAAECGKSAVGIVGGTSLCEEHSLKICMHQGCMDVTGVPHSGWYYDAGHKWHFRVPEHSAELN